VKLGLQLALESNAAVSKISL